MSTTLDSIPIPEGEPEYAAAVVVDKETGAATVRPGDHMLTAAALSPRYPPGADDAARRAHAESIFGPMTDEQWELTKRDEADHRARAEARAARDDDPPFPGGRY